MRSLYGLLLLVTLLALPAVALAQDPTPVPVTDDDVNRVAKQMYCPVCENIPLDVCPTEACRQWRETIREKLALGWDAQQIEDYFAEQYGERIRAMPSTTGLNVFVWVIPPLGVALGAFLLWRFLRANTRASQPAPTPDDAAALQDEYVARLERDLKERW
ncbi:MAG: cytochrome c-type biogenesis protein CcmH [Anaerolineales bacterium]|nr:cytochrome c-type biogenesis protein CcmH [Anaerolineales bacterium]